MVFGLFLFAFSLAAVIYTIKRLYRNQDGPVTYLNNRVNALKNEIFIYNRPNVTFPDTEIQPVLTLNGAVPTIVVYENSRVAAIYKIEPKNNGINLDGAYLHASVRVNANSTVQIDGFISRDKDKYDRDKDEGVRFQPFMLSDREGVNAALKGAGTFERGLHYPGIITTGNTRLGCICDHCRESFSLQFIHAGFSELQYFYSQNSKEILFVRYGDIPDMPVQLQEQIDEEQLSRVEAQLPPGNDGSFRFYNPLRCPHCLEPYIDFEKKKKLRKSEYYAHYYLNTSPRNFS